MRQIAGRVWNEPAVFIGLLTSAVLAIVAIATGDPWDAATIAGVAAPTLSALGIRGFVTPTHDTVTIAVEPDEQPPPSISP